MRPVATSATAKAMRPLSRASPAISKTDGGAKPPRGIGRSEVSGALAEAAEAPTAASPVRRARRVILPVMARSKPYRPSPRKPRGPR